jgi:hypothetical protein
VNVVQGRVTPYFVEVRNTSPRSQRISVLGETMHSGWAIGGATSEELAPGASAALQVLITPDVAGHSETVQLVVSARAEGDGGSRAWMPVAAASFCSADFNTDGAVDFFDYLDFVAAFSTNALVADFNRDGAVDFFDYLDFVDAFSRGC